MLTFLDEHITQYLSVHVVFKGAGGLGNGGGYKGKEQKVELIRIFGSKHNKHYVEVHLMQSKQFEEHDMHKQDDE